MANSRVWVFGADAACDVVVAAAYVSGRHCRLTSGPSGFVLDDLDSTNGTWVNGERLTGPRTVTRDDRITLGQLTALPWPTEAVAVPQAAPVPPPPSAPPPSAPSPAPHAGPAPRVITIGRGPENDVQIDAAGVSTHHARILIEGGIHTLEDLGSTNGTFLNSLENRITRCRLAPSDVVYLGAEAVPASKLLAGVAPAGAQATMAINVRDHAAALAEARAQGTAPGGAAEPPGRGGAGGRAARAAATMADSAGGGTRSSPASAILGMPRSVAAAAGAAAVFVVLFTSWLVLANRTRPTPDGTDKGRDGTQVARKDDDDADDGKGSQVDSSGGGKNPIEKNGNGAGGVGNKPGDIADAVYAVLVERQIPNQGRVLGQIGTATAIDKSRLITSAALAIEVRRHLAESWDVVAYHPASKREFRVTQATPHPEYPRAADDFTTAEQKLREGMERLQPPEAGKDDEKPDGKAKSSNKGKAGAKGGAPRAPLTAQESEALVKKLGELEDKMLDAVERQVRHDVGVLEIFGNAPATAAVAERGEAIEPGARVRVVAIPHSLEEKETKRDELRPATAQSGRFRSRGALSATAGFSELRVVLFNAAPADKTNLAGAAVIDDKHRLVAVYSRPTPPLKAGDQPPRESADIVETAVWKPLLGTGR